MKRTKQYKLEQRDRIKEIKDDAFAKGVFCGVFICFLAIMYVVVANSIFGF